jgi:long-chain acyl-CoA synthetase
VVSDSGDLSWPVVQAERLHGPVTAVTDGDRHVTYATLAQRLRALGGGLDALGVPPGGRVGVLAANSLAHLECFLGVPAHGRVVVDLNFRLATDELAFMADDAGVEVLVTDAGHRDVALELRDRCPALREVVEPDAYEALVTATAPTAFPGVAADAPATISYTGGTTGRPKGVVLSHGNLLANARHNLIATGHDPTHRWLHVAPMFHVAGTANVVAATWAGSGQVILPRFDAGAMLAAIAEHAITHLVLVPTMLAMLLDHPAFEDADLSSLRHVQYAASPISPALQRRVLEKLPCDVAQFYGMTEAAPTVTHATPEDHRRGAAGEEPYALRLASMGAPVIGVQVEVRRPDGTVAAAGEVGEVWVRGPNVMLGYWNRPEATAAALVDGWYRTGDAARMDEHGYLFMVDRLKDMIITGGENVYSVEVEAVLAEHPAVAEVAVVGVPDDRWGEAVHAIVVLAPGATAGEDDLRAHCRGRIAGYKVPRSVELRTAPLPKSGAGKLLKQELREPYWAGVGRRVG